MRPRLSPPWPAGYRLAGAAKVCLVLFALALAGCGNDGVSRRSNTVNGVPDEQLPAPEGAPGSAVTGMPGAPGPGQVGPPVPGQLAEVALDADGNPVLPDSAPLDPDAMPVQVPEQAPNALDAQPTAQDAVAVIRDYYAAINARNYAQAFALWSDDGRATGQSPQQFANGFAATNGVSVELLQPGRIEGAAGSRYVEVPVALSATQDDGSQRHYVGTYTLRRAVVDGASPDQRDWRISAADLREVQP